MGKEENIDGRDIDAGEIADDGAKRFYRGALRKAVSDSRKFYDDIERLKKEQGRNERRNRGWKKYCGIAYGRESAVRNDEVYCGLDKKVEEHDDGLSRNLVEKIQGQRIRDGQAELDKEMLGKAVNDYLYCAKRIGTVRYSSADYDDVKPRLGYKFLTKLSMAGAATLTAAAVGLMATEAVHQFKLFLKHSGESVTGLNWKYLELCYYRSLPYKIFAGGRSEPEFYYLPPALIVLGAAAGIITYCKYESLSKMFDWKRKRLEKQSDRQLTGMTESFIDNLQSGRISAQSIDYMREFGDS